MDGAQVRRGRAYLHRPWIRVCCPVGYEQALVSLKLKKPVDAEGGRTFAVIIEGG